MLKKGMNKLIHEGRRQFILLRILCGSGEGERKEDRGGEGGSDALVYTCPSYCIITITELITDEEKPPKFCRAF